MDRSITTKQPKAGVGRLRGWLGRVALAAGAFFALGAAVFAFSWFAFPFPLDRLDRRPASVRVEDRDGAPLLELVGSDDQWRYPVPLSEISPWLVQATIAVEDRRFREHSGIDGRAVLRAAWQNVSRFRVVSGASTLTMQVCRMMDDRPRTVGAKLVESFRALQLEQLRTKDQILEQYLNIAPYGRNIRGVEAASLVYFGKHARDLSLGEAALLAGLPQSPSRYRPDRDANAALARRATVLARLAERGVIGEDLRRQALEEPLVLARPGRSPRATHAAWLALAQRPDGGRMTLDGRLQEELEHVLRARSGDWPGGAQAAAVVLDIDTGELRALVGALDANDPAHGQVNGATAWRSPGSALKPLVYAAAFEDRRLAPDSLVYDVPIQRGGWSPENFDRQFSGPLPAAEALRRSLNVPAILVAEQMGIARCEGLMSAAGLTLRKDPRRGAGLAAVTGAVEVRLLDLVNAYATIGRGGIRRPVRLFTERDERRGQGVPALAAVGGSPAEVPSAPPVLDPAVCAAIDDILSTRHRRPRGLDSLPPDQIPAFMWKTGTSSGRRDAWAVGHNGRYAAGVWVGRFSGAGDEAFVGAEAAEPALAGIFALAAVRNDSPVALGARPAPGTCAAPTWVVINPLRPPRELDEPPRILSPSPGATFLAIAGRAVVHASVNRAADLSWFLNGRLIPAAEAQRLTLAPGAYELRCADAQGRSSAVRFAVR